MRAIPIELKEANAFVDKLHRHHAPVHRDKFRFGCLDDNDNLCGICQLARPVSRVLDDGYTIEVVRCCSNGTYNACSFMYSRAARIAKEMGYKRIITYILETESGVSLKASGWKLDKAYCKGGSWSCPSRPRSLVDNQINIFGDEKEKYSTLPKKRYVKYLTDNESIAKQNNMI